MAFHSRCGHSFCTSNTKLSPLPLAMYFGVQIPQHELVWVSCMFHFICIPRNHHGVVTNRVVRNELDRATCAWCGARRTHLYCCLFFLEQFFHLLCFQSCCELATVARAYSIMRLPPHPQHPVVLHQQRPPPPRRHLPILHRNVKGERLEVPHEGKDLQRSVAQQLRTTATAATTATTV
jgi:hypothetical protein